MDIRQLRYFLAVAEEGHFGRAAKRLHIVQPALSMQIRSLEDELGGKLFMRTSRHVELTEAGSLLMIEARRIIQQTEHAMTAVQKSLRGEAGKIRIGFSGIAVFTDQLSEDLRAFKKKIPNVELELREMAPHLQVKEILSGQLDIGYVPTNPTFKYDAQLKTEIVGRWPLYIGMSSDHPLAKRKQLTVKSISNEPFILYASQEGDEGPLPKLRELMGQEPNVAYRVTNTLSVIALTSSGIAISLVPEPLTKLKIPNVVFRKIASPAIFTHLTLISLLDTASGAVNAFLQITRNKKLS